MVGKLCGINYEKFFNKFTDPCVVFDISDSTPIIISVNAEFKSVFCDTESSVVGENLNELIVPEDKLQEARILDKQTEKGAANEVEVQRLTNNGLKHFLYRSIVLEDGLSLGIYTNITQRKQEEEYITVLQRILRHNLRNDLNVIKGFATKADSLVEDDTELASCMSKISEKVIELENLTEEASVIRDIINEEFEPDRNFVSIEDIVGEAVGNTITQFNNSQVGTDITEELHVKADWKLVTAFEALIDNGLRYNESEQKKVMIRGHKVSSSLVHITVSDNGIGISSVERKLVTGEKDASQLEHGSGLGLWLTKWLIESYQGSFDIHSIPRGGTVVEFWLNC